MSEVYHLDVEAYSTRFGRLREKGSHYTDVFFSMEEARQKGVQVLGEKIKDIYEASSYCTGEQGESALALSDFLDDGQVRYHFKIMAIDIDWLPFYKFSCLSELYLVRSPYLKYQFDLEGEFLHRDYYFPLDHAGDSGTYWPHHEGDDDESAGTKFALGDFVTLRRPLVSFDGIPFDTEQIFVISGVPERDDAGLLCGNTYAVDTILPDGTFTWSIDFFSLCRGIHESELCPCRQPVNETSPFRFLQKILRGEFENSEKLLAALEAGEIQLQTELVWDDIAETNESSRKD